MITQETRERMENIIKCIQAKLDGKKVEYQLPSGSWETFGDCLLDFSPHYNYRIAPEPQEKLKRWAVITRSKFVASFNSLYEAQEYAKREPVSDCVIELTETNRIETARIEPKKREPRILYLNRYKDGCWSCGFNQKHIAESQKGSGILETAVEFVEVVK